MRVLILAILTAAASLLTAACILGTPPPAPTEVPEGAPQAQSGTEAATPAATMAPTSTPQAFIVQGRTIKQYAGPPLITIDPNAGYRAVFHTNTGSFTVELFASQAPVTVNNFIFLAREGFYDGVIFHRVIQDFMIQGGDPTGAGQGGPGYQFQDEIVPELGFSEPGVMAMANAGPHTNGSQFFITVAETPHLNGQHTIFGRVVSGQDVVDTISTAGTGALSRPLAPVVIQSIDVTVAG